MMIEEVIRPIKTGIARVQKTLTAHRAAKPTLELITVGTQSFTLPLRYITAKTMSKTEIAINAAKIPATNAAKDSI